ncbi:MAG TPA: hypothetical protein VFL86_26890 [Burkholderiaceae bacterium]|nr:hypothetical protein [Burkholderiaceae bacterium]
MIVSIQLTSTSHSTNGGSSMTLRDVDLDTALTISAALRKLPHADVEAVVVVENLPTAKHPARPSHKPQPARIGAALALASWLRGLGMARPEALAR